MNKREQKTQVAVIEANICCSKLLGLSQQQFSGYRRTMSCSFRYKCWRKRPFLPSNEMLCWRGRGASPACHCSGRFLTLNGALHSLPEPFLPFISCFSIFHMLKITENQAWKCIYILKVQFKKITFKETSPLFPILLPKYCIFKFCPSSVHNVSTSFTCEKILIQTPLWLFECYENFPLTPQFSNLVTLEVRWKFLKVKVERMQN